MHGNGFSRRWALAAGLVLISSAAWGASPFDKLLSSSRVDADPNKTYTLSEDNGPWLIMACSFSGEGAQKQANDLALELRKKYKMPAFVHQMKFALDETGGRGVDRYGAPIKMKYQRGSNNIKEIAVMVGNYKSVDDPDAQEVLNKLKYMRPECLEVGAGKQTNASLAGWRIIQKEALAIMSPSSGKKNKGPMGHAFVTTNPLLPAEYFTPKGPDAFVIKMNQGVEHSLLDCRGKYTVQVAHFTGKVVIDQAEIKAISSGKSMESKLAEAADKAHRLTVALRKKGYDAYEFHDRAASIVTIGAFDSVGTPRADGKTEINPRIHTIMTTFGADQTNVPGQSGAMKPKLLDGIPFDIQPIPVEVPKRSVAAELGRSVATQY